MNFNEYQEKAGKFDTFSYEKFVAEGAKANHLGILEKVLGLAGESGEACDKIKKIIRDENGEVSELVRKELVKELGDILWYLAMVSKYLGVEFEEVAKMKNCKTVWKEIRFTAVGMIVNRGRSGGKATSSGVFES